MSLAGTQAGQQAGREGHKWARVWVGRRRSRGSGYFNTRGRRGASTCFTAEGAPPSGTPPACHHEHVAASAGCARCPAWQRPSAAATWQTGHLTGQTRRAHLRSARGRVPSSPAYCRTSASSKSFCSESGPACSSLWRLLYPRCDLRQLLLRRLPAWLSRLIELLHTLLLLLLLRRHCASACCCCGCDERNWR